MLEERKYFIRVKKEIVEVSREIYEYYYKSNRRALYLQERDRKHGLVSYHAKDKACSLCQGVTGEETIYDMFAPTPEDIAISSIMNESLYQALECLTKDEMTLVQNLFFNNLSEREWSAKTGIAQKTINDRKNRILIKIKKFMKI